MVTPKELQLIADTLRVDVLEMTTKAGSGHPSSCLSCAELMSVLWFDEMTYDPTQPKHPHTDTFILSKGHAAPIYYSCLTHARCREGDFSTFRTFGPDTHALEGHPLPSINPFIPVATGSLGQGLAIGCGIAYAHRMNKDPARTYVLMGDSECSEGSVWEAAQFASYYKLANLCALVDINRLGQRGETMLGHNMQVYKKRFESFGWQAIAINGHRIAEIQTAFIKARASKKPTVILAKTIKGKGVSFLENKEGWHGRALTESELHKARKELVRAEFPAITHTPLAKVPEKVSLLHYASTTSYEKDEVIATREGYGVGLARLAADNAQVIALDAEVSNSTYADKVARRTPHQFIECFISEQTMVGVAHGLATQGFVPFVSTFAAFLSRAHDQIRMAAISNASESLFKSLNLTFCGSHAGCSIGEDGPSQMGLEDIALMRALPDSIVLYPADAVAAERLVQTAAQTPGIKYIRTTRPKTPVIYGSKEEFSMNNFKIVKQSRHDSAILAGAGITLHEALKAHELLRKEGINTAVVDLYCIKPFPHDRFRDFVNAHGKKVVIVEDHYYEGGIGEAILPCFDGSSIRAAHLAVGTMPHSGPMKELLHHHRIDAEAIVAYARALVL